MKKISKHKECVCALSNKLDMSFGAVSKHFSILKNAGLVYEEREANNIYYWLTCNCILQLIKNAKGTFECTNKKREL